MTVVSSLIPLALKLSAAPTFAQVMADSSTVSSHFVFQILAHDQTVCFTICCIRGSLKVLLTFSSFPRSNCCSTHQPLMSMLLSSCVFHLSNSRPLGAYCITQHLYVFPAFFSPPLGHENFVSQAVQEWHSESSICVQQPISSRIKHHPRSISVVICSTLQPDASHYVSPTMI